MDEVCEQTGVTLSRVLASQDIEGSMCVHVCLGGSGFWGSSSSLPGEAKSFLVVAITKYPH